MHASCSAVVVHRRLEGLPEHFLEPHFVVSVRLQWDVCEMPVVALVLRAHVLNHLQDWPREANAHLMQLRLAMNADCLIG